MDNLGVVWNTKPKTISQITLTIRSRRVDLYDGNFVVDMAMN